MLYSFDHHDTETELEDNAETGVLADGGRTDEQLLAAVQKRDESALAVLYKRHTALLFSIVDRVINNRTDTEDTLQEIFSEIWRMADHYSPEKGKALGWIVTLARRRAIDKLRKKQAYQRAGERLRDETDRSSAEEVYQGADEESADSDRAQVLQRVLQTLPDPQREAVMYAFYKGMSQREIANHTGIPLGTIKTRIELGMRKIKTAVMAMGGAKEWSLEC